MALAGGRVSSQASSIPGSRNSWKRGKSVSPLVEQFGLGPGGEHPFPRCVDGLGDL